MARVTGGSSEIGVACRSSISVLAARATCSGRCVRPRAGDPPPWFVTNQACPARQAWLCPHRPFRAFSRSLLRPLRSGTWSSSSAVLTGAGVLVGTWLGASTSGPERVTVRVIDDGANGGPQVVATAVVPLR